MKRVFSIPYNGTTVIPFLEELSQRKDNVHDVYLTLPGALNHFSNREYRAGADYYRNCEDFFWLR